jgi:membrane protein
MVIRKPAGPDPDPRPRVSPWTLGGLSARELAERLWEKVSEDEILDRAASLSYYFLFALFPLLLFLTALIGLLPFPDLMPRLIRYGHEVLPADAASLLERTLAEISRGARGGLLSIGVLAALWAASRGIHSIIVTLNVVYDVENARPWWRRQVISVVLTITFSLFMLGALLFLVFGERLGHAVAVWVGLGPLFRQVWAIVQWPLGLLFILIAIDLVYHLAPAVRQRWYWFTPGSVFALVAWLLMSLGLRAYVANFADYTATYGSIGAVILLLLWLYVSGAAVLIGGEINSIIAQAATEHGARIATPVAPADGRRPAAEG